MDFSSPFYNAFTLATSATRHIPQKSDICCYLIVAICGATSENSVNAKFSIAPAQTVQDRRRGCVHIVGYYAPEQPAHDPSSESCLMYDGL
jgi:hypothetical protein